MRIFGRALQAQASGDPEQLRQLEAEAAKITYRTYLMLAVPSVFDLVATVRRPSWERSRAVGGGVGATAG